MSGVFLKQFFGFGGKHEVVEGQSAGLVGPHHHRNLVVGQAQLGVVVLFLGEAGHGVGEIDRGGIVVKRVLPFEMVLLDQPPPVIESGGQTKTKGRNMWDYIKLAALGVPVHRIGGADVAAELDAKRAIQQGTTLGLTL